MLYNKKKGHASLTKKNAYTYKKFFLNKIGDTPKVRLSLFIYIIRNGANRSLPHHITQKESPRVFGHQD